jgi:hypothetical protein
MTVALGFILSSDVVASVSRVDQVIEGLGCLDTVDRTRILGSTMMTKIPVTPRLFERMAKSRTRDFVRLGQRHPAVSSAVSSLSTDSTPSGGPTTQPLRPPIPFYTPTLVEKRDGEMGTGGRNSNAGVKVALFGASGFLGTYVCAELGT